MKTACLFPVVASFVLLGLSSCSKKADDIVPAQTQTTAPGSTTPGTTTTAPTITAGFRVKLDGTLFAPDLGYALATFPGGDGYYAIYGLDSKANNVVLLALPNTIGEGTYPLNDVNIGGSVMNKKEYTTANGGSGTVTIIKKSATNLTGTFSFTAYDATGTFKTTLTEGSFNVAYK